MRNRTKYILMASFFLILATLCFYYTGKNGFSTGVTLSGVVMLPIAFILIRAAQREK